MRSEEEWAAQLVRDFLEEHGFPVANQQQRMRKLVGFRRQYYGAIRIDDAKLRSAAKATGLLQ